MEEMWWPIHGGAGDAGSSRWQHDRRLWFPTRARLAVAISASCSGGRRWRLRKGVGAEERERMGLGLRFWLCEGERE